MLKRKSVTSNLTYSKDKLEVPSGKVTLGTGMDNNTVFRGVAVGSAYTQGNVLRSVYDLSDNGVLLYNATDNDNTNQIDNNRVIFNTYPTLIDFPYLTVQNRTPETVTNNSQLFPIFNSPGKGLGNIEWWTSASRITGDQSAGVQSLLPFYTNDVSTTNVKPQIINSPIFPFSGKNYSGTLVQIQVEQNDESKSYKNIKVIPYQNGRGIPQYNPSSLYFSGNPYGTPTWPVTSDPIPSQLSMGAVPGNNNASIGVILDTDKIDLNNNNNTKPQNLIYKYTEPDFVLNSNWYNHYSPFSISPTNDSSSINSVGYYAPWSSDYAYVENDPIPILTKGITSVRIGAAYNIGMMAYYEPDILPGDDPLTNDGYVSVPIVPLFQGEELRIGSYTYASVQGHIITTEQTGTSCYPPPVLSEVFDGSRNTDNPWYDWFDVTYGASGWTGTPQFQLAGIPDEGVAIIDTKNGEVLPYLSQANQGSLIVHPITTIDPTDSSGSGRMTLIGPSNYEQTTDCQFTNITKFPGTPDRSQPIGVSTVCIKGTGQWGYTGGAILSSIQTITAPGTGYSNNLNVDTYNSTQNNLLLSVDIVSGVITTVDNVGSGSTVGDYDDYPVGTQLEIVKTLNNIIYTTNARIEVTSNDGVGVIVFSIINGGTGFTDGTGVIVYTQKLNLENPKVDIITTSGTLSTITIRSTGIQNITGDTILVDSTNFTGSFTINTTIDTYGFKSIPGGYGYEINKSAELLDDSEVTLFDVLTTVTENETSFSLSNYDNTTLGNVKINQSIFIKMNQATGITLDAPGSVAAPVGGWDSYLFTQSAQFRIRPDVTEIDTIGLNYTPGTRVAGNGFGDAVNIEIYAVNSLGSITSISNEVEYVTNIDDVTIGLTTYIIIQSGATPGTFNINILSGNPNLRITGGSGYTTTTNVTALNLSTNTLFVMGQVNLPAAGNCTIYDYDPVNSATAMVMPTRLTEDGGSNFIDLSRYVVGDGIIFYQGVALESGVPSGILLINSIDVAQSKITFIQVGFGTTFVTPPSSNYAFFSTFNGTETLTTVDITTDSDGKIVGLSINTLGNRIRYGDYLLVKSGNENFVFQFTPEMDVPPAYQPFVNMRSATSTEWNDFKTNVKSSVNLLEENLLINFNPMYPNYFNNSYYFNGDGGQTNVASFG